MICTQGQHQTRTLTTQTSDTKKEYVSETKPFGYKK